MTIADSWQVHSRPSMYPPPVLQSLDSLRDTVKAEDPKTFVHVVHQVPEGAPVFTPGTELAEEFEELTPKDGEKLIGKNFPSSFAKTGLQDYLEEIGVKKVVLVGYMVCPSLGYFDAL